MTVIAPSGTGIISPSIAFPSLLCKMCYAPDCSKCKVKVTPMRSSFQDDRCADCETPGCLQCKLFQEKEPEIRCQQCGEPGCKQCPLFPLMNKEFQKIARNRWKRKT